MDVIKRMRESGNKLLETEARDIQMWSNLKHNKEDLELFLNNNIAEIKFRAKDGKDSSIVCTSNMTLVKVMATKKKADKQKSVKATSRGIKTRDSTSVNTWDLIDNKMKTINLMSWQIMNFITITPENILLLDEVATEILKK